MNSLGVSLKRKRSTTPASMNDIQSEDMTLQREVWEKLAEEQHEG